MPNFKIRCLIKNKGTTTVSAHLGASLVVSPNGTEYYSTKDDIKRNFPVGNTWLDRYLDTDLGVTGKYDLYLTLWEGEKAIGKGVKYASVMLPGVVEKKKKNIIKMQISYNSISPASFVEG